MKYTVVITIGRNIGGLAMSPKSWSEFKEAVRSSLDCAEAIVIQQPAIVSAVGDRDQLGLWEGQEEGAAAFVAFVEEDALALLEDLLDVDREDYGQEAIGFIKVAGTDHLITR